MSQFLIKIKFFQFMGNKNIFRQEQNPNFDFFKNQNLQRNCGATALTSRHNQRSTLFKDHKRTIQNSFMKDKVIKIQKKYFRVY